MADKQYVIVTAISTHRMRYCVPIDDLRDHDGTVDAKWALDLVTMEEVKEFSQYHLGEQIVDYRVVDESEMLDQFDKDNSYLKSWTRGKKLEWVNDWKDSKC